MPRASNVSALEIKMAEQNLQDAMNRYAAMTKRTALQQSLDCAWSVVMSMRKGTRVAKPFPKVVKLGFGGKRIRKGLPHYWFVRDDIHGGYIQRIRAPKKLNLPPDSGDSPVFFPEDFFSKEYVEKAFRRKRWGAARNVWHRCLSDLAAPARKSAPGFDAGELNPDAQSVGVNYGSVTIGATTGTIAEQARNTITVGNKLKYATQALRQDRRYYMALAARGIEGRIEHVLRKDARACGLEARR